GRVFFCIWTARVRPRGVLDQKQRLIHPGPKVLLQQRVRKEPLYLVQKEPLYPTGVREALGQKSHRILVEACVGIVKELIRPVRQKEEAPVFGVVIKIVVVRLIEITIPVVIERLYGPGREKGIQAHQGREALYKLLI